MTHVLVLPEVMDYKAARPLATELLSLRGQSLTLDDRSGSQPGEDGRRQYIKPHESVVERQADSNEEDHIGDRYRDEHADPGDRQRSRQPKIVQLVQTLFDSPDVRVSGKVHSRNASSS